MTIQTVAIYRLLVENSVNRIYVVILEKFVKENVAKILSFNILSILNCCVNIFN